MDGVRSAEALLRAGQPRRAAATASKALANVQKAGVSADVVAALEILVHAQCMNKDEEKSLALLKDSRAEFRQKNDKKCEALVMCLEADCFLVKSCTEDAMACAEAALDMAREERDRMGEASALRSKAKCFMQTGEFDEAIILGKAVAAILHEVNDYEGEALELLSVAELHSHLAQYDESVATAGRAADIFKDVGHVQAQATALSIGADAAFAQGVLRRISWQSVDEGALPLTTAALHLYEQAGNVEGQILSRNLIAKVLLQMQNFEEAAQAAEEALNEAKLVGNREVMGQALATRIKALLARMNFRAPTASQKSIRLWANAAVEAASQLEEVWGETITDMALWSEAQLHTASALLARGQALSENNFDNALAAANKSLEIAQEAQLRMRQAEALCLKAQIHFAAQDINQAADALGVADAMYKEDMNVDGRETTSALYRKFRSSYLWTKRKVKLEGLKEDYTAAQINASSNKWDYAPMGATGLHAASGYVHVHFDNLRGRAAKNIG